MRKILLLLPVLLFFSCGPDSDNESSDVYTLDGLALAGYDPVAYFEQGEPRIGGETERYEYAGITYAFNSEKNRLAFEADPEKYIPEYGGWCSYAVAESSTRMSPDPTQWQIQDGRLILFTSNVMTKLTGDLKDDWNLSPKEYKNKADINWEKMVNE